MYIKYKYTSTHIEKSLAPWFQKLINFHYYYFCTFAPLKNKI